MRSILLFVACCLVAIVSNSCYDSTSPPATLGVITGVIRDENANGISNASVNTFPPSSSVFTLNNGTYYIDNVLPGIYKLYASRSGYLTDSTSVTVVAGGAVIADLKLVASVPNLAPLVPSNPKPADNAPVFTGKSVILSWTCSYPENDSIKYDVFFGTSATLNSSNIIAQNIANKFYSSGQLESNIRYYWRVRARDKKNNITEGPVWTFLTAVPPSGLVLSVPFSNSYEDVSGTNHKLSTSYVEFTSDRHGVFNNALAFFGTTNSYVEVLDDTLLWIPETSGYTLSVWVNFNSNQGEYAGIVSKSRSASGGGFKGWQLTVRGSNKFNVQYGEGNSYVDVTSPLGYDNGGWHHVVLIFKRVDGTLTMYVDGEVISATQNDILKMDVNTNDNLKLGIERNDIRAFKGFIDDVKVYNKALSEPEILGLYSE